MSSAGAPSYDVQLTCAEFVLVRYHIYVSRSIDALMGGDNKVRRLLLPPPLLLYSRFICTNALVELIELDRNGNHT